MRASLQRLLTIALAAVPAAPVCAAPPGGLDHNRYKWRDAGGNLHYSDALPAEAARLGYEVVSPRGVVVKRVERQKTAEELAAANAAQAQEQAAREQRAARERADAQLLAGYPDEVDLRRAQQQKLELLDQQIKSAQVSLRNQEQTLADALGRAAEAERGNKTLPEAQARQLEQLRKQVDHQRLTVVRRENERAQALANFEIEIARYRELKTQLAERRSPR